MSIHCSNLCNHGIEDPTTTDVCGRDHLEKKTRARWALPFCVCTCSFGKLSSWLRIRISDPYTASYSPHDEADPDCLYNLTDQLDLRSWSREDPTFPR